MLIIDPIRVYQINGEVCTLNVFSFSGGPGTGLAVVLPVTNKCIRVMGYEAQNGTALGYFTFTNGSGGDPFNYPVTPPIAGDGPPLQKPVIDSGYYHTDKGVGLYVDVFGFGLNIDVYWLAFTPTT